MKVNSYLKQSKIFSYFILFLWSGDWTIQASERAKHIISNVKVDSTFIVKTFESFFSTPTYQQSFLSFVKELEKDIITPVDFNFDDKEDSKQIIQGGSGRVGIYENKKKNFSFAKKIINQGLILLLPETVPWIKRWKIFYNEIFFQNEMQKVLGCKIPKLYSFSFSPQDSSNVIFMEHFEHMFFSATLNKKFQENWKLFFSFYYELVCIIYLLHTHNLSHGDLHESNIYFCEEKNDTWLTLHYIYQGNEKQPQISYHSNEKIILVQSQFKTEIKKNILNRIRLIDFGYSSHLQTKGFGKNNLYFFNFQECLMFQLTDHVPISNLLVEYQWENGLKIKNYDIWVLGSLLLNAIESQEDVKEKQSIYVRLKTRVQDIVFHAFPEFIRKLATILSNLVDQHRFESMLKQCMQTLFATSIMIMMINDLKHRIETNRKVALEELIKNFSYPKEIDGQKNNYILFKKIPIKLSVFGIFLFENRNEYQQLLFKIYDKIAEEFIQKIVRWKYFQSQNSSAVQKAFVQFLSLCYSWTDPKIDALLLSPFLRNSYKL